MKTAAAAAACEPTGIAPVHTHSPTSAGDLANGHPGGGTEDPRGPRPEGLRVSEHHDAAGLLAGPTSSEPGVGAVSRQLRLLASEPVSAVPYGELREMAQSQIRRGCRPFDFDWDAFVADRPEWGITEVVHRRAVQEGRGRGLDLRPTDIPTDTVLSAVRDVIAAWTEQPALRPTYEDFCQEQARRGEKGRETQQALVMPRNAEILVLVAEGVPDAEIARRVGLNRSQVGRIRKAAATRSSALQEVPVFPATEVPPAERWPVVQFMKLTGVTLDAGDTRWLVDIGRCYEAEGREHELVYAIRASAGAVRDPWAYLQRCIANRGDAWTVRPQLLADVLSWAGEQSLQYALQAIGGGYVQRPLPYLRRTLQCAVSAGQCPAGRTERPVEMALAICRQWVPYLVVVDADEAVAAEDAAARVGYVESYRRRFGRLPWEEDESALDCCNGLNGVLDDEFNSLNSIPEYLDPSPGSSKADATSVEPDLECRVDPEVVPAACSEDGGQRVQGSPRLERGKVERPPETAELPVPDGILRPQSHGEGVERGQMTSGPLLRENRPPVLEHCPCRHPLASLLVSGMDLEAVAQVECAAGCGHRLYSDRGPVECPCHWPAAMAGQVARALQESNHVSAGAMESLSESLEVIAPEAGEAARGREVQELGVSGAAHETGRPVGRDGRRCRYQECVAADGLRCSGDPAADLESSSGELPCDAAGGVWAALRPPAVAGCSSAVRCLGSLHVSPGAGPVVEVGYVALRERPQVEVQCGAPGAAAVLTV